MQATRKFQLTSLALKVASIALAVAAVYAADTLPDRAYVGNAHAASPADTVTAPAPAVVPASDAWYADESAAGTRPDAAH